MTFVSPASHVFRRALPILLAAALGLLPGCSARQNAAPAAAAHSDPAQPSPGQSGPAQPPAHQVPKELAAEIGFNHAQSLFRIENRDEFAWSNCQFVLNANGKSPGYSLAVPSVKPGVKETAELRVGDFNDTAGKKFDPAAQRVATLDFDCDTPQGHLRARQFLLGEPPGQGNPPLQGNPAGQGKPQ